MNTALAACALLLVFEGLLPFASPYAWRAQVLRIAQLGNRQIRFIGLSLMIGGLLLLYLEK